MLRNYFKIAFRNIMRQKLFSAINILGMSTGVAACLLILLHVVDELSYDRFHPDADRIYQVGLHAKIGGQDISTANTPPPMARTLVAEVPGVEAATRIARYWGPPILKYDDKAFTEERVFHVDSNFFDFFGYALLEGDPTKVLTEPNTVVLTESLARKYFGEEAAIGKLITIGGSTTYEVTGICADAPGNSHFRFNVLLSSVSVDHLERDIWLNNFLYTYFRRHRDTPIEQVEAKFPELVIKYVGPEVERFMGVSMTDMGAQGGKYGFAATALTDLHLRPTTRDNIEPAGSITYVYFFMGIAAFIIVIACINFMNLSTARSAGRAKEVGLRKTLGAPRSQMIGQFLAESVLYSLFSVLVALVLCYLILPQFNLVAGKHLDMSALTQPWFLGGLAVIVLFVGVLAGSYPAFYLTSFQPVEVLKGKVRAGMKSKGVRSGLVVFQFALSTFLIIFTAVVYQQIDFMQERNIGIDKHNVLVLRNAGRLGENRKPMKDALRQQSNIVAVSYSNNSFPGVNNTTVFKSGISDQDHIMGVYFADFDHMDVMRFKLKAGRYFSPDYPSDSSAIILNEAAVKEFGFKNPIGEEVIFNDNNERFRIIGVVEDFNFESLRSEIRPLSIRLIDLSYQLLIRYAGSPSEAVATVERIWNDHAPGDPFDYVFLDENFDELFRAEQRMGNLFSGFSVLAIFIACLGLFALAAFMAEQRTREIGIRKVMGASTAGLTLMLSRDFTKLVIIAFALSAPLAWLVVDYWLDGFAYRITVSPWIFVGSGLVSTAIAWFTVSFQSIRAAGINPASSLRYE